MTSSLARYTETLEKSRLIEPDLLARQLAEFQTRQAARPVRDDAAALGLALVTSGLITPWQQERLAQGQSKGFFLGQYKLLGLLGVGGMGAVYLAEHVRMRRRVAIKVLPARLVKDKANLERFHREAQAIASLDHPNIIQAYSVDNEGDLHYLVMQYVEGRDLEQIVNQCGPLDPIRAARFIRQAADGLAHAHARGLIHRDVKPSNLLVDSAPDRDKKLSGVGLDAKKGASETVRILDLGLACAVTSEESAGGPDGEPVVGTTDYLAPEQALGSRDIDGRADIYSLGCTFYFLLTGRPPFPNGTLAEKLVKHQMEQPPEIASLRSGVPAELAAICMRMMAKQPADRYASADDVSEALAEFVPPEPGERGSSTVIRRTKAAAPAAGETWDFSGPSSQELPAAEVSAIRIRQENDRKRMLFVAGGAALALVAVVGIWAATRGGSPTLAQGNERAPAGKRGRFVPASADTLWHGATKADKSGQNGEQKQNQNPPQVVAEPPKPQPAKVPAVVDLSRKQSVFSRVDEARDYTLVYHLTIPEDANFNNHEVPYTVDNRPEIRQPFDRVAYCLELQRRGGEVEFAYVSGDPITQDLGKLGVPCSATNVRVQSPIKNLNVFSNVPGVTTGSGFQGGVEFWDTNYGQGNSAKVPGASDQAFDFGDSFSNSGGYGSMQIHNWDAKQTVLAYNYWGTASGEAGIGNQATGNPDWTFAKNIKAYTLRELYVLVRLK
jgi:serine/threonine protein kinase